MAYSPAGITTNVGQSEQSLKYSKSRSVAIALKAKRKGTTIEKLKIIMADKKSNLIEIKVAHGYALNQITPIIDK